jgi:hypothetical protein
MHHAALRPSSGQPRGDEQISGLLRPAPLGTSGSAKARGKAMVCALLISILILPRLHIQPFSRFLSLSYPHRITLLFIYALACCVTMSVPGAWPVSPAKLTLEAWSQGCMIGALIIMIGITLANMRRGVLLHKLILIEVSICRYNVNKQP